MTTALVLLLVLAPFAVMAFYIEDWSRDFSTNTAATSPTAADERLRPVEVATSLDELRSQVELFCQRESAWELGEEKPLPNDSPVLALVEGEPAATTHLVHKTGLWGFKDDVWLVAEDLGDGRLRLHADSRSRIGKGDLGQNPRNVRELMTALR